MEENYINTGLYKAKRADNGEWVEGYLIKSFTEVCYIVTHFDHILSDIVYYEVDEKTICRYTGMVNNTQKIWENDIVVAKGNYYQAFWYDECYQFAFKCVKTNSTDFLLRAAIWELWSLAKMTKLEVVGNVFDNPELTK